MDNAEEIKQVCDGAILPRQDTARYMLQYGERALGVNTHTEWAYDVWAGKKITS
jgi:hypothetical protein